MVASIHWQSTRRLTVFLAALVALAAGNAARADGQVLHNSTGLQPPVPVQDAEYPVEVFYNCMATPWLSLSPAVQYIFKPGGTDANRDVLVLGVNFGVTF